MMPCKGLVTKAARLPPLIYSRTVHELSGADGRNSGRAGMNVLLVFE
jgi:hypothetical protein